MSGHSIIAPHLSSFSLLIEAFYLHHSVTVLCYSFLQAFLVINPFFNSSLFVPLLQYVPDIGDNTCGLSLAPRSSFSSSFLVNLLRSSYSSLHFLSSYLTFRT